MAEAQFNAGRSHRNGDVRRIVVKVGSAVVAPEGRLDSQALGRVVDELLNLREGGVRVALVSSGAVAAGFRALGLHTRPVMIRQKQAAAAIGQPALMSAYAEHFARHDVRAAQVLLTADDLGDRQRFINARHTIDTLMNAGIVPVINENDSVAFDEIKLGDNDRLSALVAVAIEADLLVLLSVVPGLMDLTTGTVIDRVTNVAEVRTFADSGSTSLGTGGMATKLDAAEIVMSHGISAVLAQGPTPEMPSPIGRVLRNEAIGTRFESPCGPVRRKRKAWIAHATTARGTITIDDGAVRALVERGASLLAGGIISVEGRFDVGAPVDIADQHGARIARGLVSYASLEIEQIKGARSDAIVGILGYAYAEEVVHRDDLQLLDGGQ